MAKILWKPSEERVKNSNMYRFMTFINEKHGLTFTKYDPLYQWSLENIPAFWAAMWEFADIRASKPYDQIVDDPTKMPGAKWFTGARLNFAENLLRYRDDHMALIFKGEEQPLRRSQKASSQPNELRSGQTLLSPHTSLAPGSFCLGNRNLRACRLAPVRPRLPPCWN